MRLRTEKEPGGTYRVVTAYLGNPIGIRLLRQSSQFPHESYEGLTKEEAEKARKELEDFLDREQKKR